MEEQTPNENNLYAPLTEQEVAEERAYYEGIAEQLADAELELNELYKAANEGFSEAYSYEIPMCIERIEQLKERLNERNDPPLPL